MKRTFLLMMIAGIAIFFSSCKKDDLAHADSNYQINGFGDSPKTIDRIASQWSKDASGFYVCIFKDIIPYGRSIMGKPH